MWTHHVCCSTASEIQPLYWTNRLKRPLLVLSGFGKKNEIFQSSKRTFKCVYNNLRIHLWVTFLYKTILTKRKWQTKPFPTANNHNFKKTRNKQMWTPPDFTLLSSLAAQVPGLSNEYHTDPVKQRPWSASPNLVCACVSNSCTEAKDMWNWELMVQWPCSGNCLPFIDLVQRAVSSLVAALLCSF